MCEVVGVDHHRMLETLPVALCAVAIMLAKLSHGQGYPRSDSHQLEAIAQTQEAPRSSSESCNSHATAAAEPELTCVPDILRHQIHFRKTAPERDQRQGQHESTTDDATPEAQLLVDNSKERNARDCTTLLSVHEVVVLDETCFVVVHYHGGSENVIKASL